MFVQDDQIRFAARDQRVVRCGAGERAASCTSPPLGRCRVQGFDLPLAHRTSGVGGLCRVAAFGPVSLLVLTTCDVVKGCVVCDGATSLSFLSRYVVLWRGVSCEWEGQVNIQLTRGSVYAGHCRETTEALMYAINSQWFLPAVLEGIRRQQRPSCGVHRMLTTRRAVHRRNVPILRASCEWQTVHAILLHVTQGRHTILWRT
jgi:hypothetical protein